MKVKNLKTRIAAFGLAVLMGVSTLSSANAFAAEQTDVGQEVQASEQAATSQKEKAVTADDITKEMRIILPEKMSGCLISAVMK